MSLFGSGGAGRPESSTAEASARRETRGARREAPRKGPARLRMAAMEPHVAAHGAIAAMQQQSSQSTKTDVCLSPLSEANKDARDSGELAIETFARDACDQQAATPLNAAECAELKVS